MQSMDKREFCASFLQLNDHSKWGSLWVNLVQLLALDAKSDEREITKEIIQGFVVGKVPHPDMVWDVMTRLENKAKEKGHGFQLALVSREGEGEMSDRDRCYQAGMRLLRDLGLEV